MIQWFMMKMEILIYYYNNINLKKNNLMKTNSVIRNLLMIISISAIIICGCDNTSDNKNISDLQAFRDSIAISGEETKIVKLFYTLPSPIETAIILKKAGAIYHEDLLNKIVNADKYTNNKSMALNLGVYCADLSYASLHNQNQTSIKYMAVSKKLADKLGILNAIDQSLIKRLENNINNRDSILQIITESFYNTNSYLIENNRTQAAKMILAGGWIEGIYLSARLSKTTVNNTEIINRLIEQKLSLENLIDMLKNDSAKPDNEMIALINELQELNSLFDKIQIKSTSIETITDKNNKVTTLASKSEMQFNKADFDKVINKVEKLRASIVI